jgi:hypothetical protein
MNTFAEYCSFFLSSQKPGDHPNIMSLEAPNFCELGFLGNLDKIVNAMTLPICLTSGCRRRSNGEFSALS